MEKRALNGRYRPPSKELWRGREEKNGDAYLYQIAKMADLRGGMAAAEKNSFAIIGFASDEGVKRNLGRPGAFEGPLSLRESLGALPYCGKEPLNLFDCGDIVCSDGDLESAQQALASAVEELLSKNYHPLIAGGGHEVAWGSYQGAAAALKGKKFGIVNFDAHYDLRRTLDKGKGSSGTPFYQMQQERRERSLDFNYLCIGLQRYGNTRELFERASALSVETLFAEELFFRPMSDHKHLLKSFIDRCDLIGLSLCLDVFSSAIAPGVSAPQPLGLNPWQVIPLIRELAACNKTLYMEIAELSPRHDVAGQTSKLAAAIACDYIHYKNHSPQQSHSMNKSLLR